MPVKDKNKDKTTPIKNKTIKPCKHLHLIPLEYYFGKRVRIPGTTTSIVKYEYNTSMHACHKMRVSKYYCPECKIEIDMSIKIGN